MSSKLPEALESTEFKSLVTEIIKYLKDEKKLECENITDIITVDNFDEHKDAKNVVKYFYWRPTNDQIFKNAYDMSNTSCMFLSNGNPMGTILYLNVG